MKTKYVLGKKIKMRDNRKLRKCKICIIEFDDKEQYKDHKNDSHCPFCDAHFGLKLRLEEHMGSHEFICKLDNCEK